MNKEKITASSVNKFIRENTPRSRLWDSELGGFYLLSLTDGRGAWRVKYRGLDGKPREATIGQYPAMTDDELGQSGGERRYLSIDEVKALFKGLDAYQDKIRNQRRSSRSHGKPYLPDLDAVSFVDHVKPFILLAYYTGFRSGDIFGLRWEHVNFDFGFIRKTIEKTAHHIPEPRTFDLSDAALSVLNVWWLQHNKPKSGFVFPSKSSKSGRMEKGAMQKPWAKIKKLSGLPIELDLYSLRHNFASQLVMAGADLLTVSKLMAHTDINTTIKHYGHLQPNMARKWVNEFAKMTNDSPTEEIPVKNYLSQVS